MALLLVARTCLEGTQGRCICNRDYQCLQERETCAGIGKRAQYYFIWGLSEAGINIAGFGFNGFKDADKKQPRFDRYRNTQVVQVRRLLSGLTVPDIYCNLFCVGHACCRCQCAV